MTEPQLELREAQPYLGIHAPVIEGRVTEVGDSGPTERTTSPATAPPLDASGSGEGSIDERGGDSAAAGKRESSPDVTQPAPVEPARGALAERPVTRSDYDASEGEPW